MRKDTAVRYGYSRRITKTIEFATNMGGSNTDSASKSWVKVAGCPSDDAGHILANKLGGSGKATDRNIFPQNQSINRGAYRVYEKKIYEKLAALSKSQCRTKTIELK